MLIGAKQGGVVNAFHNLDVRPVYVDGIVHHVLVQAVTADDFSLATAEMGCVRLAGEIAWVIG